MSGNTNQQPTAGSSSTARSSQQQTSGIYSFSVHQPYTNWPLHHAHASAATAAAAYPSWYALPQSYAPQPTHPPKSLKESGVQTSEDDIQNEKRVYRRYWDQAVAAFLRRAGLYRALEGFREDVLMLNEDWERGRVQNALDALVQDVAVSRHAF